jgi:plastocyanin
MSPFSSACSVLVKACLFANLCLTALAIDSTSSGVSAPTGTPTVHVVTVGNNYDNSFHPNITYAKPGDIVSFQFWPTNHSVVRGEYAGSESCGAGGCNPCVPYELIHPGAPGMFSSGHFLVQTLPSAANMEVCS